MSETGDTDALAAEYVLGTLDGPERAQAQAMLGVDQAFAAKVRLWERRLGELHLMVEPVEPDGEIWHRIKSKVPEPAPAPEVAGAGGRDRGRQGARPGGAGEHPAGGRGRCRLGAELVGGSGHRIPGHRIPGIPGHAGPEPGDIGPDARR